MKIRANVRNFQWLDVKQPVGVASSHPLGGILLEFYTGAESRRQFHLLMSPQEAEALGQNLIEAASKNRPVAVQSLNRQGRSQEWMDDNSG